MKWIRQPQEQEGTYQFNGKFFVTRGVQELLTLEEITEICLEIRGLVKQKGGLDYLQVFVDEDSGQKLFFIDQLNKEMIASGDFKPEYNHCTLMLAEEY